MLDKITVANLLNNEINPMTQFDPVWYRIPHCHHNILIIGVMGHRKQQSFNRRLENSFFFQVYLISVQPKTFASPHRYFTSSRAAVVTLASGQRTSIVLSHQNHTSPQPCTAASHWGFVSVSSAIKYTKSQRVFWLSQDIVHILTSRLAIAVYNCTITKSTNKI